MAKNDFGTKTAEQMNIERRAAKARQQANVKAKTVTKSEHKVFNMVDTLKNIKLNARKKQQAIQNAIDNGNFLLKMAIANVCVLTYSPYDDTWERNCYDVLTAAKRHPSRFEWNRDWKETGKLMIALPKEQKKAA